MDKKSKIFFVVFFFLIATSIGATYYRYFILRDYMITAQAECDPYTEACFIWSCDPDTEGECTGDPEEDIAYYKNISRNARNIPLCNPADEDCEALVCPSGEADCTLTLCDADTVTEGVTCNDPVAYTLLHPEEDILEEELDTEGEESEVLEDGEEGASEDASSENESNVPYETVE